MKKAFVITRLMLVVFAFASLASQESSARPRTKRRTNPPPPFTGASSRPLNGWVEKALTWMHICGSPRPGRPHLRNALTVQFSRGTAHHIPTERLHDFDCFLKTKKKVSREKKDVFEGEVLYPEDKGIVDVYTGTIDVVVTEAFDDTTSSDPFYYFYFAKKYDHGEAQDALPVVTGEVDTLIDGVVRVDGYWGTEVWGFVEETVAYTTYESIQGMSPSPQTLLVWEGKRKWDEDAGDWEAWKAGDFKVNDFEYLPHAVD